MKFPTAKKIRESMKQSNEETMKIVKESFIEEKEKFFQRNHYFFKSRFF